MTICYDHLLRKGLAWHLTKTSKGRRVMTADEGSYVLGAYLSAGMDRIHFHVIEGVAMHPRELSFRRASEPVASGLLATHRLFE
jgi:hypothetical protein